MKKTKFMRAALLLLVLTLITSCFVGGTFAKYTTSTTGSDSARVAYWGFDQDASTTINLFDGVYNNVKASGEVDGFSKVIAPGTSKSSTFAFGYTNYKTNEIKAPEVAYTFVVSTDGSNCSENIQNNANIQWKLDGVLAPAVGTEDDANYAAAGSWKALIAAIEALDGNKTDNRYEPNTLPKAFESAGLNEHTVGWEWVFHTDATADTTDTDMGNATDLNAPDLANVTLKITITATQID